jgi:hypothetical protein
VSIAIIGFSSDRTISYTLERFASIGVPFSFLGLDECGTAERMVVERDGKHVVVQFDNRVFRLEDHRSIYHRLKFQSFASRERSLFFQQLLAILYASLNASKQLVVNPPHLGSENHNKFLHLESLRLFSFKTPDQVIVGNPEVAVALRLASPDWVNKGCSALKTECVAGSDGLAQRLPLLSGCPSLFQRRIKGADARVHVVGNDLFGLHILSGSIDYRFPSRGIQPVFTEIEIPTSVALRCLSYARHKGLPFIGFDFKIDEQSGGWIVLEANPMPGYDMFDRRMHGAISLALAKLLGCRASDRECNSGEPFICAERIHL